MDASSNPALEEAARALAAAAAAPLTVTGEETLTVVRDLERIARHLGELTAAVRDRWAEWGTVTPHLERAEALAADATRCLSHAAGTYAFNAKARSVVPLDAGHNPHPSCLTTSSEVSCGPHSSKSRHGSRSPSAPRPPGVVAVPLLR